MAHQFENDLPREQLHAVATALLTGTFTAARVKDAWVVAEYAIVRILDDGLIGADRLTTDGEASVLEDARGMADGLVHGAFPWAALLAIILRAIQAAL